MPSQKVTATMSNTETGQTLGMRPDNTTQASAGMAKRERTVRFCGQGPFTWPNSAERKVI